MDDHKYLPLYDFPKVIFDSDRNHTEEALNYLSNWSHKMIDGILYFGEYFCVVEKYDQLIDYIKLLWVNSLIGFVYDGLNLELHTLGLEQNEKLVEYLKQTCLWKLHWIKSESGGNYYFKITLDHTDVIELIKKTEWSGDEFYYVVWNGKIIEETKTNILEYALLKYDTVKKSKGHLYITEIVKKETLA